MAADTQDITDFYTTQLGGLTADLLRRELDALWPAITGLSVLGIGHAIPCLEPWQEKARCLGLSPSHMGGVAWPPEKPNMICVAETDALPFPDLSFDRVLLVHGLEQAENARRTLREVWRVLKDDGRLIVVLPNRRSMWAYAESTPFGHGQPYSEGQLSRLLKGLFFTVERQKTALYAPPLNIKLALRFFWLAERYGPFLAPHFAGLVIAEASKALYGATPVRRRALARRVLVAAERASARRELDTDSHTGGPPA